MEVVAASIEWTIEDPLTPGNACKDVAKRPVKEPLGWYRYFSLVTHFFQSMLNPDWLSQAIATSCIS
jgi:hypothetical protein